MDTNVVASAILFGGVPAECLRRASAGDLDLVTSRALLSEFEETLTKLGLTPESAAILRSDLELAADVVMPGPIEATSRDPDDDFVVATAVAGKVDHIVTGDRDLLSLGVVRGIPIITPRDLLRLLSER